VRELKQNNLDLHAILLLEVFIYFRQKQICTYIHQEKYDHTI